MDHKVITLIKWLFLAIGLGLSVGAAFVEGSAFATAILLLLGLSFSLIGGGIIALGWWSQKKEAHLREHGFLVQAEFQQVEVNEALEVNGANPFRIIAQWHDVKNNRLFVFKSANLWFNPERFVKDRQIPVYIDLDKPSRYHVDTSFLPKLQN